MSGRQPLILLDVAGVLAPFRRPGPAWRSHRVPAAWGTTNLLLNSDHGPALMRLAADHDAELVWATAGGEYADSHVGPLLGLPSLTVLRVDAPTDYGVDWRIHSKTWQVARQVGRRPFVWFDDELTEADQRWLEAKAVGAFKLIHVGYLNGLGDRHIQEADDWLLVNG